MLVVSFSPLPPFFPAADIVSRCHPFKGLRGEGRERTKGGLCSSRFSVFLPAPCGMGFDQYSSLFGTKYELLNQLQLYSSQLWTSVTLGESLPWTVWSPHHLTIGGKEQEKRGIFLTNFEGLSINQTAGKRKKNSRLPSWVRSPLPLPLLSFYAVLPFSEAFFPQIIPPFPSSLRFPFSVVPSPPP